MFLIPELMVGNVESSLKQQRANSLRIFFLQVTNYVYTTMQQAKQQTKTKRNKKYIIGRCKRQIR